MSLTPAELQTWLDFGAPDPEIERTLLRDIIQAYPELRIPVTQRLHDACKGQICVTKPQSPIEDWLELVCERFREN